MAANLYDAAFGSLGRIFGADARRPITALTLAGGFASTVSWPRRISCSRRLAGAEPISSTPHCSRSSPRRSRAGLAAQRPDAQPGEIRRDGGAGQGAAAFWLAVPAVAAAFAFLRLRASGLSAHLLAIFARGGVDAGTVGVDRRLVRTGAGRGPLIEFAFGRNLHPLWVVRFALGTLHRAIAMLMLLGISAPVAAAFALMFGGANGLVHHYARRGAARAVSAPPATAG